MRVSRRGWLLAVGVAIALSSFGAFRYYQNSHKIQYLTARVDRGDVESTITATGNCNAVVTVQVGSQVSGNIIALYADFNTKVKKGQLVARIDPALFQAAADQADANLNAAKAAVVTAQANLAKSQSDLASALANVASQKANVVKSQSAVNLAKIESDRREVLVKEGATSQEDADSARAASEQAVAVTDATQAALQAAEASADSARKQVEVAQTMLDQAGAMKKQAAAALETAQINLDHTRIIAPVDGTVVSRNMDVGQTVAASFQAPTIFLIAQDLTKMQVDTNVDESDVGPIRLDQTATFTVDAYPGTVFVGKVTQIRQAPINVQNVITYDVVIGVANLDLKLFPGMTATVKILIDQVRGALRIPSAALRFHPSTTTTTTPSAKTGPTKAVAGTRTIYVLDNGQPKPILVQLGITDGNYAVAKSGNLAEGQQVITGVASKITSAPASQAMPRRM